MSCYFGLYFGNTNMCLCMNKDNKTEVLANAAGYRVTPSVLAFLDGTEKVVGLDAKQAMHKNAANTITNIKDLICFEKQVEQIEDNSQNKVNGKIGKSNLEKNGCISNRGVRDFLLMLFSYLKDIACSHSHDDVYPTVLTVPLSFTEKQRELVRDVAIDAGFEVLRIISEPSAAALAYSIGESNDSTSKCLVFRMGGSSLDVTVLEVSNGMYTVLSYIQRKDFGGHQVTDCIANFCASEFQRQFKANVKENKRSLMKLRTAAEHYKHVVHGSISERCQVESLYDGIDLNVNISKARFDSLVHNTLLQCLEPIHEALKAASLPITAINTVVLSGGSCKIPKLQQLISSLLSSAIVLSSIIPDEVIAIGAAKQATLVSEGIDENIDCFINLLSHDLSIKLSGISNCPEELLLCSKATLIPTVITQSFTVIQDSSLRVEIYEGNIESAQGTNALLAVLNMPNLPMGDIYFSFHIRSDGSLFVVCKDCSSKELGSTIVIPPRQCT